VRILLFPFTRLGDMDARRAVQDYLPALRATLPESWWQCRRRAVSVVPRPCQHIDQFHRGARCRPDGQRDNDAGAGDVGESTARRHPYVSLARWRASNIAASRALRTFLGIVKPPMAFGISFESAIAQARHVANNGQFALRSCGSGASGSFRGLARTVAMPAGRFGDGRSRRPQAMSTILTLVTTDGSGKGRNRFANRLVTALARILLDSVPRVAPPGVASRAVVSRGVASSDTRARREMVWPPKSRSASRSTHCRSSGPITNCRFVTVRGSCVRCANWLRIDVGKATATSTRSSSRSCIWLLRRRFQDSESPTPGGPDSSRQPILSASAQYRLLHADAVGRVHRR
jgi:hypothetical protein